MSATAFVGARIMTPCAIDDDTSVSCYLNEIPPFIGPALAGLYGTLHSSLPFFEVFRSTEQASCYVAQRAGQPSCIFVFALRGNCLDVLNEMIEVSRDEITRFTRYVFAHFDAVDIIRFRAVDTQLGNFDHPFQQYGAKATYCVPLPATADDYTASLGPATRTSMRRKMNRLTKAFPTWRMEYRSAGMIGDGELGEIMRLSEATINANHVKLRYDRARITAMAGKCGFVALLLIDGRICAGLISYRIGTSYFSEVIGFDREYDKFGIGTLAAYLAIRECAARGGKRFCLGGGHFDYKLRLGAKMLSMDELRIYRSSWKMLLNLGHAARAALGAKGRQFKEFLHRHNDHVLARPVFDAYYLVRSRRLK
jgi:hypothetical protein